MTLEQRIARLESQNTRLRRGIPASVFAVIAIALVSAAPPRWTKVVATERLEIVDDKGEMRAMVSQEKNAGYITLFDAKGNERMTIGADVSGQPGIVVFDSNHKVRIDITANEEKAYASFNHSDTEGTSIGATTIDKGNFAYLTIAQREQNQKSKAITIALGAKGLPTMSIRDASGKEIWGVP